MKKSTINEIKAKALASLDGIPLWPANTRPTDEQLNQAFDMAPPIGAITIAAAEMDRARASESALLARVAELEAAAAGETGTPKAEGRYLCEIAKPAGHNWGPIASYFRNGRWQTSYTVTRYWRLPGETYTEIPR